MPGISIGLDLGTSRIRAVSAGFTVTDGGFDTEKKHFWQTKQILDAPLIVARDHYIQSTAAFGQKAADIYERSPGTLDFIRPVRNASVTDVKEISRVLRELVAKCAQNGLFKPKLAVAVPYGISRTEKTVLTELCISAGAGRVRLIPSPVCAALGERLDFSADRTVCIADIGAGKTEISVLADNEIKNCVDVGFGSEAFDSDIKDYVETQRDVIIGEKTASTIKMQLGCAVMRREEIAFVYAGKNKLNGCPERFELNSSEVYWILKDRLDHFTEETARLFSQVEPSLLGNSFGSDLVLTGDGAMLYGLRTLLKSRLGLNSSIGRYGGRSVVEGLSVMLKRRDVFDRRYCTEPD